MTACPIRYQRQVPDRKGKIFYTSITSLSHISKRCRVVTELHEKTALLELVRHECMTADGSVQKSEFSDGTYVICDFAEQIYEIGYGS